MADFEIRVGGMACEGCANSVRSAVAKVAPAARVEVDLAARKVAVAGAPSREAVAAAIVKAGYEILG